MLKHATLDKHGYREHTNTISDLHRLLISTNMVVASLGAKPPIHVDFKMVVSPSFSVQHRVRGCANDVADINDYIRHNLH